MAEEEAQEPAVGLAATIRAADYATALATVRDALADGLEAAHGSRLIHRAPLAKQLVEVLGKLEELPNAERKSTSDDLRARRAARRAAASGQ